MKTPIRERFRRGGGALLRISLALGIIASGTVLAAAPAAQAADIGPALTNVEAAMEPSTLSIPQNGNASFTIKFDACVPNAAETGDTWTVGLPPQATGSWPVGFNITNPADPTETWIRVDIAGETATYTLTEAGAAVNNLCFKSQFGGRFNATMEQGEHPVEVVIPGKTVTIGTVDVGEPMEPDYVRLPKEFQKSLGFRTGDQCANTVEGCIGAVIYLPKGDHGVVTVKDVASPNWEFKADGPLLPIILTDLGNGVADYSLAPDRLTTITFTAGEIEAVMDSAGLADNQSLYIDFRINAKNPTGGTPTEFRNTATGVKEGSEPWSSSNRIVSTYAGGVADGAFISIKKKDVAGNDAQTADSAVDLTATDGTTGLVFTIVNSGTQTLHDIRVSDAVTQGSASVSDLTCTFPDGSKGTTWDGPFESTKSFTCTAQLTGVFAPHANTATVLAKGDGNEDIRSTDPYHATGTAKTTVTTPVAPTVNPAECTVDTQGKTVWETVAQPENGNSITYGDVKVSDDHVATLTATPDKGYTLDKDKLGAGWKINDDGTATWTHQLKSKDCAAAPPVTPNTPGLATTGSSLPMGLAGGAAALLLAGLVTTLAARRHRANQL